MKLICCGLNLAPHTMGSPKEGTDALDFGCPQCGKQFAITVWSQEEYEARHDRYNKRRQELGFPIRPPQVSEVIP